MNIRMCGVFALLTVASLAPVHAAFKVDIGGTIVADNGVGDLNDLPGVIQYSDQGTDFHSSCTGASRNAPRRSRQEI